MYRPGLVALTLLAGCDAVFGLGEPADAGAGTPGDGGEPDDGAPLDGDGVTADAGTAIVCGLDEFEGGAGPWTTTYTGSCPQALCTLTFEGGAAVARLPAQGGLTATFAPPLDLTGGSVTIAATPAASVSTTSQLRVTTSTNERLGIGITADVNGNRTLVGTHTSLSGSVKLFEAPYDANAHQRWKIEHALGGATGAELIVSTQATGAAGWTELARVEAPADASSTVAELAVERASEGMTVSADATVITFDEFTVCAR